MDELKPCPMIMHEHFCIVTGNSCTSTKPSLCNALQKACNFGSNRRPAPENNPLTLDQLRQMEGEPVWIQRGKKGTYRVVKDVSCGGTYGGEVRFTDSGPTGLRIEDYCKTWVPYARKPIQEDKNEKAD